MLISIMGAPACRDRAPQTLETGAPSAEAPRVQYMSYADAKAVLAAFSGSVPAAVRASAGAAEAGWAQWTKAQDTAIRARLAQGDEDSVVNFWLYGTTFTQLPRATRADLARRGQDDGEKLLIARLDDLVEALANPEGNERLKFVRQVVERHGIDVTTDEGKDRASELLVGMRARMIGEANRHDLEAAAAARRGRGAALDTFSTIYRERGLSSDTMSRSAPRAAISPMCGRLPRSRSPPQPSTMISRPVVSGRRARRAPSTAAGLWL